MRAVSSPSLSDNPLEIITTNNNESTQNTDIDISTNLTDKNCYSSTGILFLNDFYENISQKRIPMKKYLYAFCFIDTTNNKSVLDKFKKTFSHLKGKPLNSSSSNNSNKVESTKLLVTTQQNHARGDTKHR